MAKRLSREEKWQKAVVDIINEMFVFAGHAVTYDDIKDRKDAWYSEWTITIDQYEEWMVWGRKYLQKNLKLNKAWAQREMAMVGLNWGLKFDRMPTPEDFDKIN
jgi:hypothetical protein